MTRLAAASISAAHDIAWRTIYMRSSAVFLVFTMCTRSSEFAALYHYFTRVFHNNLGWRCCSFKMSVPSADSPGPRRGIFLGLFYQPSWLLPGMQEVIVAHV